MRCWFCGQPIVKDDWRWGESGRSQAHVIHHLDGNHDNDVKENRVDAHHGCHTRYHVMQHHPNSFKTHCKRNHPLSGDNVRIAVRPSGRVTRECLACRKLRPSGDRERINELQRIRRGGG